MNLPQNNENLAIEHMQMLLLFVRWYRETPVENLRIDYAARARARAVVLKQLAESTRDKTLVWAANEAADVVRRFVK